MALTIASPMTALTKVMAAPANAATPATMQYMIKRHQMQLGWATRATECSVATARLIASGRAAETWSALLEMQRALQDQLHEQTIDWFKGLAAWGRECAQLRAANTMSKMVEQDFNLLAQFGQLVGDQATNVANIFESAQVGYAYWVSEKLDS
jgi:galactokinase